MDSTLRFIAEDAARLAAFIYGDKIETVRRNRSPRPIKVRSRKGSISRIIYPPAVRDRYPYTDRARPWWATYDTVETKEWTKRWCENTAALERHVLATIGASIYREVLGRLRFELAKLGREDRDRAKRMIKAIVAKVIRSRLALAADG